MPEPDDPDTPRPGDEAEQAPHHERPTEPAPAGEQDAPAEPAASEAPTEPAPSDPAPDPGEAPTEPAPSEAPADPGDPPTEPAPAAAGLGDGPERPAVAAAVPDPEPGQDPGHAPGQDPGHDPGAPRRLTRSGSDRVLGGVAGGLGRYFGIDPIVFRIVFVVLTLVGGAGALAYLAALLFVPPDQAGADREGSNRVLRYIGFGVLVVAALSFLGPGLFFLAPGLLPLAILAGIVVLLVRGAGSSDSAARTLARLALALLILALAAGGAVAVATGAALGGGVLIAVAAIAAGLGLVGGAFFGGARWLIIPALVLVAPLGFVAASGLSIEGGTGEREYRPAAVGDLPGEYRLGAGELVVDLRGVRLPAGDTPLRVSMGAGHALVYVPEGVCVASTVDVGAGYAQVLDRENGGFDIDWEERPVSTAGAPRLVLDADVDLGAIEVRHREVAFDRDDVDRGPGDRDLGGDRGPSLGDDAGDNRACTETA